MHSKALIGRGTFFLEACDTTKAQSKGIAKQIAILATVIKKATQLRFSNIILLTNSKGTEKQVATSPGDPLE